MAMGPPVTLAGEMVAAGEVEVGAAVVRLAEVRTPCTRVWIGAPTGNHAKGGVNGRNVLVGMGGEGKQVITLEPGNCQGFYLPVSDAGEVWLKGFVAGDVVEYVVFQ